MLLVAVLLLPQCAPIFSFCLICLLLLFSNAFSTTTYE